MAWAAVVVGGASLIYGVAKDASAKKKEKAALREKESMKRPFEKVQDEYFQNKNIAEQIATGGITDASKNEYQRQQDKGITAGVSALEEGGGDINQIAKLFDNYSAKTTTLAAEDSVQHQRNIEYYMGVNKDVAGQKTIQYGVNELQPYENKLKELSQRISAEKQNAENGANQAIGSAASIATSLSSTNFGKTTPSRQAEDPYIAPSKVDAALSSTGTDIDTSKAVAKYLTRSSGDVSYNKMNNDVFEGN